MISRQALEDRLHLCEEQLIELEEEIEYIKNKIIVWERFRKKFVDSVGLEYLEDCMKAEDELRGVIHD